MKQSFLKRTYSIAIVALIGTMLLPSLTFAQVKSPKKAAFLSLLVPGLGEMYAGGKKSSRFFFFTEGLFWTGLIGFKKLNRARINTFEAYAAAHAGTNLDGKQNSHLDRVAAYNSIYDYNARLVFVEGEFANPLPETQTNTWEWDASDSRNQFVALRSKATWARTRSFLFVGALLFNRFASAFNAAHIAHNTLPTASLVPTPQGDIQAQLTFQF
ncbi:MAG: hypothetical protein HOE48_21860 [Candidatus Latescibacteria bacterium]|jgi:hypothetical protein|nr:hypothetical protein [Candidatus Latescibacterota bacterium]MBT4140572.1 hypothetical protein [Candidatus Latescibacterota bacterium]